MAASTTWIALFISKSSLLKESYLDGIPSKCSLNGVGGGGQGAMRLLVVFGSDISEATSILFLELQ